ncbi:MAG TPA: glycosyltransferase family A protein [Candidatus Bathyarchaeia archaeon]|nr:glycosyltransferase family A protein [Candidatus Bathyarchaeia archaeon]
MDSLKFSVVIPLYNKEKSIQRAIDSVLNQAYPNFELIIINDGSNDNSLSAATIYEHHPKIKIITQENRGECAARNRGIKEAAFDYIAFLDADDSWEPGFLTEILNLIRKYPDCGIYATSFQRIISSSKTEQQKFVGIPFANDGRDGIINNFFFSMAYGQDPIGTASAVCIPKKIFTECGLFLEKTKQLQEDVEMWIRIACRYPVAFSGKVCVNYHCDAENRACLNFTLESDIHPVERTIDKLFHEGHCSPTNMTFLKEYLALIYFSNAVRCLAHRQPALTRKLARKVQTKRLGLKIKGLGAFCLSFLPPWLTGHILFLILPEHIRNMGRDQKK